MRMADSPQVDDSQLALLIDLYQLTMTQAYWKEGLQQRATFSLFFRHLPPRRRFMLACGQQHAAALVSKLRFDTHAIEQLAGTGRFAADFLDWLSQWRFEGDIHTLREGTPVFANQPLLEVEAPIAHAQLLESLLMNLIQLETVLASKAVRLVMAAQGRPVIDFGMRRMQGIDAAVRGVRAYRAAGIAGTSHVLGGLRHGLPLNGTMAHSYVLAHDDEEDAFHRFASLYPDTTLLVDTHDTLEGIRKVIALMQRHPELTVKAVRLDSGDLGALARQGRALLDSAGHHDIRIIASSGLDETAISALLAEGAPIDAFGVGTQMGVSADAPVVDLSYKLVAYGGTPRIKHSTGKTHLPCAKQLYRRHDSQGQYLGDIMALRDEASPEAPCEPLLKPLVRGGQLDDTEYAQAHRANQRVADALKRMPASVLALEDDEKDQDKTQDDHSGYPVALSAGLEALRDDRQ